MLVPPDMDDGWKPEIGISHLFSASGKIGYALFDAAIEAASNRNYQQEEAGITY